MRNFSSDKEHRRGIFAGSHAGAAADAGGGEKGLVGDWLRNRNQICFGSTAGIDCDVPPRLLYTVKSRAIDHEVFDNWKRFSAPRLDCDRVTVFELAHMQLASGCTTLGSVWAAVDDHSTGAANTFTAVVTEGHRLLTLRSQLLIEHVEHFEKRHVLVDIIELVIAKRTFILATFLAPNFEFDLHVAYRPLQNSFWHYGIKRKMGLLSPMQGVLNRDQMRRYDELAIAQGKIPGVVLMENAGRSACEYLLQILLDAPARKTNIVVVCGPGNNGGDGFVLARHLMAKKPAEWALRVLALCSAEDFRGDAAIHLAVLRALVPEIVAFVETPDAVFQETIAQADVIVDAIFGTGLNRAVAGKFHQAIEIINAGNALRFSLDVPSGLDCNTGCTLGVAVKAQHTITFAHLKPGLLTPAGSEIAGKLRTIDLGFPDQEILRQCGQTASLVEAGDVSEWLCPRGKDTHKYRAGNVLVIAGSPGKTGAAKLAAQAVLRAGAGLATICTWSELLPALAGQVLETMLLPIERKNIAASLESALRKRHAIIIGPGFGLDDNARKALTFVMQNTEVPLVIDADALTLLAENPHLAAHLPTRAVLTPHSGELARLLQVSADTIEQDRFGAVRKAAEKYGCVVVLKGAHTLIANQEQILVSPWANPVLATAGSGDVLAGILAALLVHLKPLQAAAAAVYLHGAAGALWQRSQRCDRGMLASDLLQFLPTAWAEL